MNTENMPLDYNFDSCADVDTLNQAYQMCLAPFVTEHEERITPVEKELADFAKPFQEEYDIATKAVYEAAQCAWGHQEKMMREQLESIRRKALDRMRIVERKYAKIQEGIQGLHDSDPVVVQATKIFKEAIKEQDEKRDAVVAESFKLFQETIAPIQEQYKKRFKELDVQPVKASGVLH
jgi:hypothetical protein